MKQCTNKLCLSWYPSTDEFFYKQKIKRKNEITYTLSSWCKSCLRQKANEYRVEHLEEISKYKKGYYSKSENKKVKTEHNKKYYLDHKESFKSRLKEWQKSDTGRVRTREYQNLRKAKSHRILDSEWYDCQIYFNFRCAYCGKTWEQNFEETKKGLHREHVVFNGRNDLKNCVPACMSCNSSKGEYTLNHWFKEQPFYTRERYLKIYQWLRYDVSKYIKKKRVSSNES